MMLQAKNFLQQQNTAANIHVELFEAKSQKSKLKNDNSISETDVPKSNITVQFDGRSFDFKLSYNSESILDAALQQGV
ncbi:hypothetical protein ACKI10_47240, partial [Streptomyces galilaeus]|uniref:hypothetical protein n=1 Tax=Streptomyces galilaeus TaxID=33899 RepID=UPI0038F6B87D